MGIVSEGKTRKSLDQCVMSSRLHCEGKARSTVNHYVRKETEENTQVAISV